MRICFCGYTVLVVRHQYSPMLAERLLHFISYVAIYNVSLTACQGERSLQNVKILETMVFTLTQIINASMDRDDQKRKINR